MSSISKNKKRKNKKKYFQSNKKHKTGVLESGLKGFLITCNNEPPCVKESYNILNEFADELYGPEFKAASDLAELDIEEELNREIADMKSKKRRFQQVNTMVKGILFINTSVPDPTNLATSIFDSVLQTGRKGRYILKMIPIIATCKANQNDIRKHLDDYLQEFVEDNKNKLSYKIESRIRHNNNISSSHLMWYIRESVEKFAPEWVVSLMEPEIVFSIHVLRSICCIGILKNYMKYRKYNLSEVASVNDKNTSESNSKDNCDKHESTEAHVLNDESNLPEDCDNKVSCTMADNKKDNITSENEVSNDKNVTP